MRLRSIVTLFIVLMLFPYLAGCQPGGQTTATQITDLEYTQAVETIAAELTKRAPRITQSSIAQAAISVTPIVELVIQTNTPEPSETLPPTSTPRPTFTPIPTDSPTPEFTPTVTNTPEPAWEMVFQDPLKSGYWVTERNENYQMQYSHGGYSISSELKNDIAYSVRNDVYSNVRVKVDSERIAGPGDGYYGIICNFQNSGNYHFLGVGVDGWYGIGIKQGSQMRYIEEGIDHSGAIKKGNSLNTLQADCTQGKLTLWVNDISIASVNDSTFTTGMVGVGVGNRVLTGMHMVFTNFEVFSIEQQP